MQVTSNQKVTLLFGLIFVVLAPILGIAAARATLVDQKEITITKESNLTIQKAYNYNFSVTAGQTVVIKFSVYSENVSATLKILGKGSFDEEYVKNTTLPQDLTGRYFYWTVASWGGSYAYCPRYVTCSRDDFYNIEFKGDGDGSDIWSEPGNYVIVVYGTNAGTGASDVNVKFNLTVTIDGMGPIFSTVLNIIGWTILGLVALSLILDFRKRVVGGN